MAQELRVHTDLSLLPNTHVRRLTTARNSGSRAPKASSHQRHAHKPYCTELNRVTVKFKKQRDIKYQAWWLHL